jgi:hypothetical protein
LSAFAPEIHHRTHEPCDPRQVAISDHTSPTGITAIEVELHHRWNAEVSAVIDELTPSCAGRPVEEIEPLLRARLERLGVSFADAAIMRWSMIIAFG